MALRFSGGAATRWWRCDSVVALRLGGGAAIQRWRCNPAETARGAHPHRRKPAEVDPAIVSK
ncbi:hypothetical protein GCM10010443_02620 [Actinoplanes cyaneus]